MPRPRPSNFHIEYSGNFLSHAHALDYLRITALSLVINWRSARIERKLTIKKNHTEWYGSFLTGNFLSSQAASSQVLSAPMGLTSMFGMDIGVSPSLLSLYLKVVPSKLYRSITEALCFGRVVKS